MFRGMWQKKALFVNVGKILQAKEMLPLTIKYDPKFV